MQDIELRLRTDIARLCKVITLLPHRLEAGALDSSARTFFIELFFFSIGYYSG